MNDLSRSHKREPESHPGVVVCRRGCCVVVQQQPASRYRQSAQPPQLQGGVSLGPGRRLWRYLGRREAIRKAFSGQHVKCDLNG